MRVVTISIALQPMLAVICEGWQEPRRVVCGTALAHPGKCPHCLRVLTQAEYDAAIREAAELRSGAA